EGDAAVGRRAVFERFEKESETRFGFFFCHPEGVKNLALNVLAVNTDGTGAEFGAVEDNVVGQGANHSGVGLELVHIFFVRRCEGVMSGGPALLLLVVFEHGKVRDPEEAIVAALEKAMLGGILLAECDAQEAGGS